MSNADELWKLKQLLDSGAITADEFEAEKKKVLQAQPVVQPPAYRPPKLKKYRLERALSVAGMAFAIYCSFFTVFNYLQTYFPFEDISRGFVHDVPKNLIILCVSIITLFLAIFRGNRPVLLLACNLITGITVGIFHTSYVTLSAGIVLVIPTVMLAVKLLSKYKEKAKKARFYEWAWLWTLLFIGAYWVWLFLPVHQPAVTVSGETAYFNTTAEEFIAGFQERTSIRLPVLEFEKSEDDAESGAFYIGASEESAVYVYLSTNTEGNVTNVRILTDHAHIEQAGSTYQDAGVEWGLYINATGRELKVDLNETVKMLQSEHTRKSDFNSEVKNHIAYFYFYNFDDDYNLETMYVGFDAMAEDDR